MTDTNYEALSKPGGTISYQSWKWMCVMKAAPLLISGFVIGVIASMTWNRFWNPPLPSSVANAWGTFPATPKVELLDNGRELKLLEDFVYIDPRKNAWVAPKGSIVNGASIPRVFWTFVGGPLEGRYRNASIVHDVACVEMNVPSEDVHYMFYEACRCGGLDEGNAKTLYKAVYSYGPKWALETQIESASITTPDGDIVTREIQKSVGVPLRAEVQPTPDLREKIQIFVLEKSPTLDQLKQFDPGPI